MTSGCSLNLEDIVCPRPPQFKPKVLAQSSNILVNLPELNSIVQQKSHLQNIDNCNEKNRNKAVRKPKVSMMTFLKKKYKHFGQKPLHYH